MRLFCITNDGEHVTNASLERAAAARGVEVVRVDARTYRLGQDPAPEAGDAMYRVAPGVGASRLERYLFHPRVATFHLEAWRPLYGSYEQLPVFRQAGLPTVRVNPWPHPHPDTLDEQAAALGGPPWVIKVPGLWSGMGVIKVDTLAGLRSVMGYLLSSNERPLLMEWFDLELAWRTVVVGDRVVDSNAKRPPPDGFRTNRDGSTDVPGPIVAPDEVIRLSLEACRALRWAFGGVDILQDRAGNLVITEVNNPTYYARQEQVTGYDISGEMLDWLAARAVALKGQA